MNIQSQNDALNFDYMTKDCKILIWYLFKYFIEELNEVIQWIAKQLDLKVYGILSKKYFFYIDWDKFWIKNWH